MQSSNEVGWDDLPQPKSYEKRQWVKCSCCGWVGYYDYMPYSMSNPILTLGCNHHWSHFSVDIDEDEAKRAFDPTPEEISAEIAMLRDQLATEKEMADRLAGRLAQWLGFDSGDNADAEVIADYRKLRGSDTT